MLSEEEKKAIEKLSNGEKIELISLIRVFKREGIENFVITRKEYIETVLNLITKLQKENEHWKNGFERELEDNRKNTCELLKQDLEIREKDKQIDLMAKYISNLEIDEDICMKNIANTELCNEKYSNCKECIKQYFERKEKEC